ncbi:Spy/CpxP family protein refolding chaperone [candidate division KSB1 bacterium]|nr:Spy/CpxP family protein refolding chaperone [candidate division KSB1 bacterium]
MKTRYLWSVLVVLFIAGTALAQKMMDIRVDDEGPNKIMIMKKGMGDDLNLTETQEKSFQRLKLENEKEKLPWKNKLENRQLDFKTELLNEKPDLQTLNNIIDEIYKYKAELQKKDIALKFKLRELLTDEQKKTWDKTEGRIDCCGMTYDTDVQVKKMIWISEDDEEVELEGPPSKKVEKRVEIK